jgi:hypothetical protein
VDPIRRHIGAVIALVVCLVVQLAIIEPAERRRRRAQANFALVGNALASIPETQGGRFACPCCGHLTLTDEPPGTYLICDVCFWEDDEVQFRDPDYEGGANAVSLNQARQSFQAYGASELHFKSIVRDPLPEEQP